MRGKGVYHALVVGTCVCFSALFLYGFHLHKALGKATQFDIHGLPTLGSKNASVQIVVFTDFRCEGCQWFHEHVFPEIYQRFIVTNLASYTLVPIAFLGGTKPAVNAAIWMHKEYPQYFFAYYDQLHQTFQQASANISPNTLVQCAEKVGSVNTKSLKSCIAKGKYYDEMDRYFQMAQKVMKNKVATPSVYINGKSCSLSSVSHVLKTIEKQTKKLGLNTKKEGAHEKT